MNADFPLDPDLSSTLPLSKALLMPRIAIESISPVLDGGEAGRRGAAHRRSRPHLRHSH